MFSGFYTAASGMLMNQRKLDASANNMANQSTPGYQAKTVIASTFENVLLRQQSGQEIQIGSGSPISIVSEEAIDFSQGSFKETNRSYDIALQGSGFFVIENNGQQYFTRNGNFDRDEQGYLVLRGIGRVQGENGPIRVDNAFFQVTSNGSVFSENGTLLGRLRIEEPVDYNALEQNVNGTYTVGNTQTRRANATTKQGWLEQSNVDLSQEMTNAMSIQRAFQSCGKALTLVDQMNQKTAGEIGRI